MQFTAFWHFVQLILTVINMVRASDLSPKRNKTPKTQQVCNGPEIHNLFCKVRLQRLQKQKYKVGRASAFTLFLIPHISRTVASLLLSAILSNLQCKRLL